MNEFSVIVGAPRSDVGVCGVDTTILEMPERFYTEVRGRRTILGIPFGKFLRNLANHQAAALGEELHHAEFTITSSPVTVESLGQVHDCDRCRQGVRTAVEQMREHPGREMVVGQLFWAVPQS